MTAQHRTYFGKALPHVVIRGRVYYYWAKEKAGRQVRGRGESAAEQPADSEIRYRFHAPRA